jgi:hypothetical protein
MTTATQPVAYRQGTSTMGDHARANGAGDARSDTGEHFELLRVCEIVWTVVGQQRKDNSRLVSKK